MKKAKAKRKPVKNVFNHKAKKLEETEMGLVNTCIKSMEIFMLSIILKPRSKNKSTRNFEEENILFFS